MDTFYYWLNWLAIILIYVIPLIFLPFLLLSEYRQWRKLPEEEKRRIRERPWWR